ncbi:MAG: TlpA family protein disulfide reductase [Actinobacteria bacterium]|nr:TlpA family protein disulfide reductase [Actinomycetota bacterium]
MKCFVTVLVLLMAACAPANQESSSIESFAPCSSIKYSGMKANGTFVECLEGEGEIALEAIKGPAVISAWASWCSNCEAQRENFLRLYEEAGDQLQVIGVDMEEQSKAKGYEHALKRGMAYPQLYDPDGRTIDFFGPGVPITRFVGASGELAYLKIGGIFSYDEMRDLIKAHLDINVP